MTSKKSSFNNKTDFNVAMLLLFISNYKQNTFLEYEVNKKSTDKYYAGQKFLLLC